MYGLLLQSAADHLKGKYGEETWDRIRKEANISLSGFATHNIYSENIMVDLATAAAKVTGDTLDTIMDSFGVEFVNFVGQFGYDRILKVLGRHMRDFLNGLDNLHEYLRFSYPKLKPPSFFVEDETKNGLTLTYRSRRRGFLHYVKGQIRQVGKVFYNTRVDIFMVANDYNEDTQTTHVKFRLLFDNKAFRDISAHSVDTIVDSIPLRPELLFELFPFHIVFSRKMEIRSVGPGLRNVLPSALGKNLVDLFNLERPLTNFSWEDILHHTNNVFQLVGRTSLVKTCEVDESGNPIEKTDSEPNESQEIIVDSPEGSHYDNPSYSSVLHLKGQMMYMHEWDCIMFLGTPIMSSLDGMFKIGLFINDLSMHDSSRDLVLAGTQQSAELKLALDQEQEKSRLLEMSMIKLDQEMQRTDALLYQMIPKPVADRLRKGEPSVDTCQVFDNVTILFSDVVGFTTICSQITPMEVVSMLNAMYTQFDQLSERHSVYKVETIGDAYMAVSGAPIVTKYHALHMCDMALDMRSSMSKLKNPSNNETMKIRIGTHTGTTVAGVVGLKMPRYCLFGDTVNTASRMETSGESMKIHISETTRNELGGYPYEVVERGSIEVKGKGKMKTYWLIGKKEIKEQDLSKCPFISIMEEEVKTRNNDEKTDYSSSRLNMDAGYPVSSSPLPYSPVSYKDVLEERNSPGGRKGSTVSIDSEAHRLGATKSPRGSKSLPPGCPFAMGLFGEPPAGDSTPKDSEKQSPGKKNFDKGLPVKKKSPDIPPASPEKNSNATASKPTAAAATQPQPASKPSIPEPTSINDHHGNNNKNITHSQPSKATVSQTVMSSKPSTTVSKAPAGGSPKSTTVSKAPAGDSPKFTTDSKAPLPVKNIQSGIQPSHTVAQSNPVYPTKAIDSSFSTKPNNSVASKSVEGNENSSSNTSPLDSISPLNNKSVDNDSIKTLNSRAASVATIKSSSNKRDFIHSGLHNNEDSPLKETNTRTENGTPGNGLDSNKQNFDIYQTNKLTNVPNGNHVIKTDVGCLSRTNFDKGLTNRKSKLCQLL